MEQHLIYHGRINPPGVRNIEALLVAAMREACSRVVLHLCSEGGDVNAGIGLYNFIRSLPITVDTHAFGMCGSIAATVFVAGERRTSAQINSFSLHAASYAEGPLAGSISPNTDLISAPFRGRLGWDDGEITRYFSSMASQSLSPEAALKLRIVDQIQDLALPTDPGQIRAVLIPST